MTENKDIIGKPINDLKNINENESEFNSLNSNISEKRELIYQGGGPIAIQKQHDKQRMTCRERIKYLLDSGEELFEIATFASYGMYKEYGNIASAGIVTGIGKIKGKESMVIANDATVKAGAYFEITLKKTLRAQEIASKNNLPIIYLVDSAGVFLPLQDHVFPDENHFGKIFYNNARISSKGISQIACVMGPCVAGGAYLPVMCDKYVIVEGASMFLAGPALVKAAIGQEIDQNTLGGANTHSSISGIADYREKDDISAIDRIRTIIDNINIKENNIFNKNKDFLNPHFKTRELNSLFNPQKLTTYDMLEIIARIVDDSSFYEYKKDYGKTLICGNCSIGGIRVGIVANQKKHIKTDNSGIQLGGVIYSDSADKAARFVMNCNQDKIPILFIHDVNGFMVGKDAEWGGIAKDGAKLVNAVSNSTVPKISLVIGGSYGAGNYAMSGRSYEPNFLFAWPSAKIAVMGADTAAKTLTQIKTAKMGNLSEEKINEIYNQIKNEYLKQSEVTYAAARLWIDEIILPNETRDKLIYALNIINKIKDIEKPNYGVLQV
ncbi:MAG: methylcrotonoyl-CoA carboxylase [Candidatus Marinimicrobia bacterium]|nr:methylcrotonoyl-CoA carboxylase [Candidatus Neomarinimicrobiota bacterium]